VISALTPVTCEDASVEARGVRLRRTVNMVTLATPLGLLLARLGGARLERGPHGVLLARGYRLGVPAPRAPAVTVGEVVLLRLDDAQLASRPRMLDHEARHAVQWACWLGPIGFVPAYLTASAWSWLRCRDFAVRNPFEVRAGLADGGYPEPTPKTARRAGDIARPGH
jgi:hypothetical protein